MYKNVHGSIVCTSPKLEASHMSNNSRMDETQYIHTVEYYRRVKVNKLHLHTTTYILVCEPYRRTKRKKLDTKELYDSISTNNSKQVKLVWFSTCVSDDLFRKARGGVTGCRRASGGVTGCRRARRGMTGCRRARGVVTGCRRARGVVMGCRRARGGVMGSSVEGTSGVGPISDPGR